MSIEKGVVSTSIAGNIRGLQHIGIPTVDIKATIEWYRKVLGFETVYETSIQEEKGITKVAFLRLGSLVVEAYQPEGPVFEKSGKRLPGPVDHIALDVDDINEVYQSITKAGIAVLEGGTRQLPFWQNGVSFFTILGPNLEKIEFNQLL